MSLHNCSLVTGLGIALFAATAGICGTAVEGEADGIANELEFAVDLPSLMIERYPELHAASAEAMRRQFSTAGAPWANPGAGSVSLALSDEQAQSSSTPGAQGGGGQATRRGSCSTTQCRVLVGVAVAAAVVLIVGYLGYDEITDTVLDGLDAASVAHPRRE